MGVRHVQELQYTPARVQSAPVMAKLWLVSRHRGGSGGDGNDGINRRRRTGISMGLTHVPLHDRTV